MKIKFLLLFLIFLTLVFTACENQPTEIATFNATTFVQSLISYDSTANAHIPLRTVALCEPVLLLAIIPLYPYEQDVTEMGHTEQTRRPMVALTFDDGPSEYTERILDALEKHGGRATFFVLGNRVERHADTVRRAAGLESQVLGHSWNHTNFTRAHIDVVRSQILDTSEVIAYVLGSPTPPMFRAPYGALNSNVRRLSRELGYSIINWTLDTQDWRDRDADAIYGRIMDSVIDGTIVLMHDVYATTMEAAERAIASLTEQGFQLVTVSELIEYFEGEPKPGVEYRGIRPGER